MNTIPYDKQKPFIASGIRVGTPSATTRGMREEEMKFIGDTITRIIRNADNDAELAAVRKEVEALCARFPVYG